MENEANTYFIQIYDEFNDCIHTEWIIGKMWMHIMDKLTWQKEHYRLVCQVVVYLPTREGDTIGKLKTSTYEYYDSYWHFMGVRIR